LASVALLFDFGKGSFANKVWFGGGNAKP